MTDPVETPNDQTLNDQTLNDQTPNDQTRPPAKKALVWRWLDELNPALLVVLALPLLLAPWPLTPGAQPHALEKLQLLSAGTLTRPLDIFDLLMHTTPAALAVVALGRALMRRRGQGGSPAE